MTEQKITSKKDINDYLNDFILFLMVALVLYLSFASNIWIGLFTLTIMFYIYVNYFYKVYLFRNIIELKYLFKIKQITIDNVQYIEIVTDRNTLTLSISIKLKNAKRRINLSNGDRDNLLKILFFFSNNQCKIIDNRKLLSKYNIELDDLDNINDATKN